MWMHQLNLPTLRYRGMESFFSPSHIIFGPECQVWRSPTRLIPVQRRYSAVTVKCIQQSKQQFCLSISPINPAKMTVGPGSLSLLFLSVRLSLLSALLTSLSAFSRQPGQDWQQPIRASLSEEKTWWSMMHKQDINSETLELRKASFQAWRRHNLCVFFLGFYQRGIWLRRVFKSVTF